MKCENVHSVQRSVLAFSEIHVSPEGKFLHKYKSILFISGRFMHFTLFISGIFILALFIRGLFIHFSFIY